MAEAVLTIFSTPACPVCDRLAALLREKGIKYRLLDVTADRRALLQLLRFAGRPIVPTVVAYGEVMVGFDPVRLDQLLRGFQARADAFERRETDEREQLEESEQYVQQAAREAIIYGDDEEPPPDE